MFVFKIRKGTIEKKPDFKEKMQNARHLLKNN